MKRIAPNADHIPRAPAHIDTFFGRRIYEQHMWLTLAEQVYTNQCIYWFAPNVLSAAGFHVVKVTTLAEKLIKFL